MELMGASWHRGGDGSGPASLAWVLLPGPQLLLKGPFRSSLPVRVGVCGDVGLSAPSTRLTGQGGQWQEVTRGRIFPEQIATKSFGIKRIDKQEKGET